MRLFALAVLALSIVAGGCGGSKDSNEPSRAASTSAKPLSKKTFLARGDAICAEMQSELIPITQRVERARDMSGARQLEELAEIWGDQRELTQRFRDRFAALPPPRGEEARMSQFLDTLDDGLAASDDIVAALEAGQQPPRDVMQRYASAVYRGNVLASGYGFTVCGRTE
jgi:hypothetical protein